MAPIQSSSAHATRRRLESVRERKARLFRGGGRAPERSRRHTKFSAPPHLSPRHLSCARRHSGISAKVHTEPPGGTFLSCSRAAFHHNPPIPDSTVTYCRPLRV